MVLHLLAYFLGPLNQTVILQRINNLQHIKHSGKSDSLLSVSVGGPLAKIREARNHIILQYIILKIFKWAL